MVKSILKKEFKTACLTYEELLTLFFQIEQIINNRPFSYVYLSDIETCITPNHLLYGYRLECVAITPVCPFDPQSQPTISSDSVNLILDHF